MSQNAISIPFVAVSNCCTPNGIPDTAMSSTKVQRWSQQDTSITVYKVRKYRLCRARVSIKCSEVPSLRTEVAQASFSSYPCDY